MKPEENQTKTITKEKPNTNAIPCQSQPKNNSKNGKELPNGKMTQKNITKPNTTTTGRNMTKPEIIQPTTERTDNKKKLTNNHNWYNRSN